MKTVVLLATFNGEEFIVDQLKSIKDQEVQSDAVIIRDDASSDATASLIRDFIRQNKLNWVFSVNKKNVGWRANFMDLLHESDADIVFFSDQDDIWHSDKIKVVKESFMKISNIGVLVSDYRFFPKRPAWKLTNIRKIPTNYERLFRVAPTVQEFFSVRDGCSFAIRSNMVKIIENFFQMIPTDFFGKAMSHDLASWLAGLYCGKTYYIETSLLEHRYHMDSAWQLENKTIIAPKNLFQQNLQLISYLSRILAMKSFLSPKQIDSRFVEVLCNKLQDLKIENSILKIQKNRRLIMLISKFHKYSSVRRALASSLRVLRQ
ncbi:hypothetical protein AO499_08725 [Oenococcus oeni]|uniref:glycosyltransferase n=2 Tax=Oenococcus oeni TaxID=1247 RepID=UPI00067ACB64|nr:glycosyltransferase [Oenococcus oeni]PDH77548.1 hypothetical protein AO499_08725 [Oenococcus oeni]